MYAVACSDVPIGLCRAHAEHSLRDSLFLIRLRGKGVLGPGFWLGFDQAWGTDSPAGKRGGFDRMRPTVSRVPPNLAAFGRSWPEAGPRLAQDRSDLGSSTECGSMLAQLHPVLGLRRIGFLRPVLHSPEHARFPIWLVVLVGTLWAPPGTSTFAQGVAVTCGELLVRVHAAFRKAWAL